MFLSQIYIIGVVVQIGGLRVVYRYQESPIIMFQWLYSFIGEVMMKYIVAEHKCRTVPSITWPGQISDVEIN